MINPAETWAQFRGALALELSRPETAWAEIWHSPRKRTSFYADDLIPRVADRMKLIHAREWIGIDHVLWGPSGNVSGPRVLIESENDASDSAHEMRKLCSAHAPLRVLMSVERWDDASDRWAGRGRRKELLRTWLGIRQSWYRDWPDAGFVAAVVGEWGPDDVLRYFCFRLPSAGDVSDSLDPLVALTTRAS